MTPLYEQVRPQTLGEIVGQPKAVSAALALLNNGVGGQVAWICGPSSTGKTSIARILAHSISDPICVTELVARDLTADRLRQIEREQCLYGWGKGGRAYICNEAHGLSAYAAEWCLGHLEPPPPHVFWCFTTSWAGEEKLFEDDRVNAPMLLSRCKRISTTNQGFCKPMAELLRSVAQSRGLDGKPIEAYIALMRECGNNPRAAYQRIESGEMLLTAD